MGLDRDADIDRASMPYRSARNIGSSLCEASKNLRNSHVGQTHKQPERSEYNSSLHGSEVHGMELWYALKVMRTQASYVNGKNVRNHIQSRCHGFRTLPLI